MYIPVSLFSTKLQSEGIQEQFHDARGLRKVSYPGGVVVLITVGENLTRRRGFLSGPLLLMSFREKKITPFSFLQRLPQRLSF